MVPESLFSFAGTLVQWCDTLLRFALEFARELIVAICRCENQFAQTVSIFTQPPLSPTHKQNSSPSTMKPNSSPFLNGPQNWWYKMYGLPKSHQEDIHGQTKSAKNRQHTLILENRGWKTHVRISKKKKNDVIRLMRVVGCIICFRASRK